MTKLDKLKLRFINLAQSAINSYGTYIIYKVYLKNDDCNTPKLLLSVYERDLAKAEAVMEILIDFYGVSCDELLELVEARSQEYKRAYREKVLRVLKIHVEY